MLFNSYNFIIFFPIVVFLYYIIPHRIRYLWLLITSYFFYMCWNVKYSLILAFSTIVTFGGGLLLEKSKIIKDEKKRNKNKKIIIILTITINLLILFTFKYLDFLINNINSILNFFNINIIESSFNLLLPVGISFYIFQALGYTIDVYRDNIKAEKNILKYALFVSFFPQLVAGPIERAKNLLEQINNEIHKFDFQMIKDGLLIMLWGYFQKIVIADRIAIIVDTVFNSFPKYDGIYIIVAVMLFAIQIYCDFSGYSMIAIGAAKVMGFRIMENFNSPYMSMSVTEFWKRWHISLSTWFKDYLYIPLGGNRKGIIRKYINIMIVFLISGLWHGANWTFVIWGMLNRIITNNRYIIKEIQRLDSSCV